MTISKLIDDLKWKVFLFKIRMCLINYEKVQKAIRRRYCHKGYHKLTRCSSQWTNKSRTIRVEYLSCQHCNWRFFANQKDKLKYERQTKLWAKKTKEAFSAMLKYPSR